jgi:hypothetical protein
MASKSVSPEMNFNPRFEIVDYFDSLINKIDIDAEMKIALLEKNRNSTSFESLRQINAIRNKYLEIIKQIQSINLDIYERDKENKDSILDHLKRIDRVKRNKVLFKKFGFYLNNQSLETYSKNTLGLLVVLDWYLSENDLNLLM